MCHKNSFKSGQSLCPSSSGSEFHNAGAAPGNDLAPRVAVQDDGT